jgi:hypothetical protein
MKDSYELFRIPLVFAAAWSIGASLYVLLTPIALHEQIAVSSPGVSGSSAEVILQASWYEVQGLWGVIILLIFSLIFASMGYFALRNDIRALAFASPLAVTLTILAGFSIGPFYFPAVIALAAGWAAWGVARLIALKEEGSA